jgi:hypothetical protein
VETLGLSDSKAHDEGRLKSLFWPSIRTTNDVDSLGTQGLWVCVIVGVLAFLLSILAAQIIVGAFVLLFYYLSGVGVREKSRFAARMVLAVFVSDSLAAGFGIPRLIVSGLLLSNLRATWMAARWQPDSDEALTPPRFSESWGDKFADILPSWLWPKVRILYYVLSVSLLIVVLVGAAAVLTRRFS